MSFKKLAHNFQERLNRELLWSELQRAKILFLLLGIGFFSGILIWTLIPRLVEDFKLFNNPYTPILLVSTSVFLLILEGSVILRIRWVRKRGRVASSFRQYFQVIMEMLIPATILLGMCYLEGSHDYLEAPPFYLYYLFLILTLLHLDFWIPVVAGTIAFASYVFVSFWILDQFEEPAGGFMNHPIIHYEKGFFLFICGLLLGFIARELKSRIVTSYEAEQERNQVKMLFGQQVSPEIVEELLLDPSKRDSKKLEVTIMFMDIRDFTPFASSRSPEEVIRFQNAVFSPIIKIIHQHGGIINQILGDGFMATFGAPVSIPNHATAALQTALEMVELMGELSDSGAIPSTRIGIGLHTGEVIAGNIGNHIRQQYSITGTAVITAARLEQLNKEYNTQLIVSSSTLQKAEANLNILKPIGPVLLKGQSETVDIFGC